MDEEAKCKYCLLSVATSVGTVHSNSALTCHGPKAWPKRGQPKVLFIACDIVRRHGLQYLSTYQQRPRRMDEEAKCKHCCLWPCQRAWSAVTQHLPAMAPKHGRRGGNQRCCSLPVTSSGSMGLRYLGTYQQRQQRMDEEAKCKHCCLWPHQRARSAVTQHLPAMAPKHGQRGGNQRCCSLPVTSSGGMGLRYLSTYQR